VLCEAGVECESCADDESLLSCLKIFLSLSIVNVCVCVLFCNRDVIGIDEGAKMILKIEDA
jgi:hypothetical protein